MIASDWEAETLDRRMIAWLGSDEQGLARKRRLYLIALCRHFWKYLSSPTTRRAVEVAESFVDGGRTADELLAAHTSHRDEHVARITEGGKRSVHTREAQLSACAYEASRPDACTLIAAWSPAVMPITTGLLRDIFGHRVLKTAFDPGWRISDARGLAQTIYDDRAFDRLPILADALTDAGCDNEAVLAHCRSDGPHVRGCWVVDAVLAKE